MSVHTIFKYDYIEPTGRFLESKASMDEVLILSSIGALGIIIGKLCFHFFLSSSFQKSHTGNNTWIDFYHANRSKIYAIFGLIVITLSMFNIIYSFQQIGVVPKTILPWPLNALIFWFLITGATIVAAFFLGIDEKNGHNNPMYSYIFYLAIASICTISILSRGQYIYVALALFLVFLVDQNHFKKIGFKNFLALILIGAILFIFSTYFVTLFRNQLYFGFEFISLQSNSPIFSNNDLANTFNTISQLFVDRWIGLEGIMSVLSYPDKSFQLFLTASLYQPEIGQSDIYQKVCQSHYQFIDLKHFNFVALPGLFGFMYLSGSKIFLFLIVAMLMFIVIYFEKIIDIKFNNVFLTSFFGIFAGNTLFATSGSFPLALKFWSLLGILLFILHWIQTNKFDSFYNFFSRQKK